MEDIQLIITEQDVREARRLSPSSTSRFHQHTPASMALGRLTDSHWYTVGSIMLMEERIPFRTCLISSPLRVQLEKFLEDGEMEPGCFQVEAEPTKPRGDDPNHA